MNRLAGVAYLTIDGKAYRLAGDFEYSVSKISRETLIGQDGVHGYKEMPKAGHLAGTLRDGADLTIGTLNNMTNVSGIVELANGKMITGRNMWQVGDLDVKSTEGTVEFRLEGPDVTEA